MRRSGGQWRWDKCSRREPPSLFHYHQAGRSEFFFPLVEGSRSPDALLANIFTPVTPASAPYFDFIPPMYRRCSYRLASIEQPQFCYVLICYKKAPVMSSGIVPPFVLACLSRILHAESDGGVCAVEGTMVNEKAKMSFLSVHVTWRVR